jgi:hypothetical protein
MCRKLQKTLPSPNMAHFFIAKPFWSPNLGGSFLKVFPTNSRLTYTWMPVYEIEKYNILRTLKKNKFLPQFSFIFTKIHIFFDIWFWSTNEIH